MDANDHWRHLVIQYVLEVLFSASWNETCYLQVSESLYQMQTFRPDLDPPKKKRRFAFMPGIIVKPPTHHKRSESLLHAGRHRPQAVVDLSWRLSENQADNRLTCDPRVLEGPENVDLGVGEHHPRPRGVLNGVSGLAVLACNTADGTGEMVALKGLDILEEGEVHVSSLL